MTKTILSPRRPAARLLAGLACATALASAAMAQQAAPASAPAMASSAVATATAASAPVDPMADRSLATFHVKPADNAWRAALPRDADQATQAFMDRLPADVVARSNAYFEGGYWLILWDWLIGLAVAAVLLGGARSARLRDWARGKGARGDFLTDLRYAGAYWVVTTLVTLPMTIYEGFWREHRYAMSNQDFGAWFGDWAKGFVISGIVFMLVVPLLYRGIRRIGERWWMVGAGGAIALAVVALLAVPVFVEPLFNKYQPVQDPVIKNAVLAMAHADGVPADNVYEFDASRQTTRVSANVSGIFGTAAVRLNDNLLHKAALPEIRAVMGHELGHYVMNHIYKGLCEIALVLLAGFAFTNWLMKAALRRWGAGWRVTSLGDIASLPLFVAAFSTFFFLATPINNTLTRTQEIEADRFGLNLAREPMGEAEVDLKLTEYRKPDPGAFEEFVFFDHPSTRFRIHDAMRWRQAMGSDGVTPFPQ